MRNLIIWSIVLIKVSFVCFFYFTNYFIIATFHQNELKYDFFIPTRSLCNDIYYYHWSIANSFSSHQISSVQSLSRVWLFVTPWTAACQASVSITISWGLLKLTSIELVMPSNHLILCSLILLPPSIFPSIKDFSNKSVLAIKWPKYWSFSFKYYSFQWILRIDFL